MGESGAGINDGYNDGRGVGEGVPGSESGDVGTDDAVGLAGVGEGPLGGEAGVVGGGVDVEEVIGLDEFVAAGGAQAGDGFSGSFAGGRSENAEVVETRKFSDEAATFKILGGIGADAMEDAG